MNTAITLFRDLSHHTDSPIYLTYPHLIIFCIIRYAKHQIHAALRHLINLQRIRIDPRELRLHLYRNRSISPVKRCLIGNKQIYIKLPFLRVLRVDILSERSQRSGNIRRAAGHSEPLLTDWLHMLLRRTVHAGNRPYFKRIYIEETLSVQGDPGQYRIIQCTLCDIHILALAGDLVHTQSEQCKSDRRATLGIVVLIRQIIINREALQMSGGTDTTGQVHTFLYNIIPKSPARLQQSLILICLCQICHRAVQIDRTHRMPFRRRLLPHRLVRLGIRRCIVCKFRKDHFIIRAAHFLHEIILTRTSGVDKILRLIEVLLIAGHTRQLDQSDLDLFMARIAVNLAFLCSERITDQIREPAQTVQHFPLPGSLIVGNCRLHQMTCRVELMPLTQICPAFVRLLNRKVGIDIAILALRICDQVNDLIGRRLQRRIRIAGQ